MNNSQNHCKEILIDNATENVTPEAIDLIVKRCQQQHDKAIFVIFADIFKALGRLFEQKEIVHHLPVK
ncbi:MAG: hypothetical protein GY799_21770 [Desulfobulbaceae bacterium]|nr:hypothetical protein [Desulfobulbaceae bacterium]